MHFVKSIYDGKKKNEDLRVNWEEVTVYSQNIYPLLRCYIEQLELDPPTTKLG